ncbi:aspartate/glutamate racemase family protein [Salinispira pacifica]
MSRTIAVIPPIRVEEFERKRRLDQYARYAGADTKIDVRVLRGGPPLTDREYELLWTSAYMLLEAESAWQEGAAAIVVDCTADPAITEMIEAVDIPVVGALSAGVHTALQLSRRFSVLALDTDWARMIEAKVAAYGMASHLASIETVGTHVYQPSRGRNMDQNETDEFYTRLLAAGRTARDRGAESIVLGSTTIIDGCDRLQDDLDLPVIAPGIAALKTAEMMIDLGLRVSRTAFPKPVFPYGREMNAILDAASR